jgi:CheY-like chemotaxis protein
MLEARATVMVVDDEPLVLKAVQSMLKTKGYEVLPASNGQEALDIFKERTGPIQLLVSDINMPRMKGLELGRRLWSLYPGLPILFMSGHDMHTPEMQAFLDSAEFNKVKTIQKPFIASVLLAEVERILGESGLPEVSS